VAGNKDGDNSQYLPNLKDSLNCIYSDLGGPKQSERVVLCRVFQTPKYMLKGTKKGFFFIVLKLNDRLLLKKGETVSLNVFSHFIHLFKVTCILSSLKLALKVLIC